MVFYLRRIAFYLVTLWAAISLNFLLPRMMPGDPAAIMIGKLRRASGGRELSEETVKAIYALLGADKSVPAWDQYLAYWGRLLSGDLGISSTRYPYPVATLIGNALPWTLLMVGAATVISFVLGIVIGAWVGWKRGTWLDHLVPATSLLQSIPYFWLALVLVAAFSVQLRWLPIVGAYDVFAFPSGPEWSWEFALSALYHAFLPALTIVISSVGGWLLGMRNMMVSTMSEDYVLTAEAKGLRPGRIRDRYAARNAAIPSLAGLQHRARLRRRRLDRDRAGVQLPGHREADDPERPGPRLRADAGRVPRDHADRAGRQLPDGPVLRPHRPPGAQPWLTASRASATCCRPGRASSAPGW